jgi:competence protein ComEC
MVGIIKSPAEARGVYFGKVSSRYLFEIEGMKRETFEWQAITGLALIRIQTEKDYQYGDRLLVKGTIKNPKSEYRNPKQIRNPKFQKTNFNYAKYLENQNIFAIINASEKNVTLLSHNYKSNLLLRYAYLIREKVKNQFLEKMPLESGAFMRAILLGDRSELPKHLQEAFKNSGTMHIIAISGLNVGLVVVFFVYFFRFIRLRREISYIITMLFLVFLMLLTGSSPSVTRAVIMCIVFLIGMLLGRPVDPYNTLAIAALFILLKNPKDFFDVGFQLSFLAVLSMIYFTPKLMRLVKDNVNFYIRKYLWSPFAVSLSASIGTFPFIMHYFRMFVPISIISNIFIVPLMFVLMVSGLCFSVLSWIPFIGKFLAIFNHILASTIFFLADFFAGIRFGHFYIS